MIGKVISTNWSKACYAHAREVYMFFKNVPPYRAVVSFCGNSLVARRKIKKGEHILSFKDLKPQLERTYQTIEISPDQHVLEDYLAKINHSCDPTIIVDTENRVCIAARDIEPEEDLTFFYPSTETVIARPFKCLCGAHNCIDYVTGALSLPRHLLNGRLLSPHVLKQIEVAGTDSKNIA